MLGGNTKRAKVFTKFRENLPEDSWLAAFNWIRRYIKGEIPEDVFLAAGSAINSIELAVRSLPQDWTSYLHTLDVLRSDSLYKDGDLIASMIYAGLNPDNKQLQERLRNDQQGLEIVTQFGRSLFFLTISDEYLQSRLNLQSITEFWAKKFLNGQLTREQLLKTAENIRSIWSALLKFKEDSGINKDQWWGNLKYKVDNLLVCEAIAEYGEQIAIVFQMGLFPTDKMVDYITHRGTLAPKDIETLQQATKSGNFDHQNELQKEIEYTEFLKIPQVRGVNGFGPVTEFKNITFINAAERVSLTTNEIREARVAAYEAAGFYQLVKEGIESGRRAIVLGNQRYGDLFVLRPLERLLAQLNLVERRLAYVHSGKSKQNAVSFIFDQKDIEQSFIENLINKTPDVYVVDGTSNPFTHENPSYPRLPASMLTYLAWFLAFNDACGQDLPSIYNDLRKGETYKDILGFISSFSPSVPFRITQWVPYPSQKISFGGNLLVSYNPPTFERPPQVIFASPIIKPGQDNQLPDELNNHTPGYFDDLEQKVGNNIGLIFTPFGLQSSDGRDLNQIIGHVQEAITDFLPDFVKVRPEHKLRL